MTSSLPRILTILALCAGLAACHTTRLGQSIDFPAPQQQQRPAT